jgi:16S rRNA (uracil1498-N3)-methyltransferase
VARFLIKPSQVKAGLVTLTAGAFHHAAHVLRLGIGDHIIVAHPGREYEAIIEHIDAHSLAARLISERPLLPAPPIALTVIQSVIKAGGMDLVIEKCSELGAERLIPVATRHSVVSLSSSRITSRHARWERIAEAAAKQCGRHQPMTILPAISLADAVSESAPDLLLVPHEVEREHSIAHALRHHRDACSVAVAIGPEGGFAPEEVELLESAEGILVSLGPRTLRSETAAIAAAAIVLYELGGLEPAP